MQYTRVIRRGPPSDTAARAGLAEQGTNNSSPQDEEGEGGRVSRQGKGAPGRGEGRGGPEAWAATGVGW